MPSMDMQLKGTPLWFRSGTLNGQPAEKEFHQWMKFVGQHLVRTLVKTQ